MQKVAMNVSRRKILGGLSALAGLPAFSWLNQLEIPKDIPKGMTILFQGDSITDAGRDKGAYYANDGRGMGQGYVRHTVTELLGSHADKDLKFYNRGISGHKVFQLRNRWKDDCLILQPDVLSILIGVNDYWHTLDWNYDGTSEVYERDFRGLLDQTKDQLPEVQLIIGEPFVLHDGTSIKKDKWEGAFEEYQVAARGIAKDYSATFIPYQEIFEEALKVAPTSYWCPDGVHPSMAGNFLMSSAWLDAFYKTVG